MNITPPRRVDIVRKYIYIKIYSFAPHLIRHSCEACNPVWSTHGTAYINTRKNNNNREGLIWKTNTKLYTSAYNIIMYNVVKVGSDRKKELFKIKKPITDHEQQHWDQRFIDIIKCMEIFVRITSGRVKRGDSDYDREKKTKCI